MPYSLKLDEPYGSQGWKVKIREKERLEPPHVTVMKGPNSWRWDLRTKSFMDKQPPPRDVPSEIVDQLLSQHEVLKEQWDKKYPHNKV